ncbi:MAG: hypothetical protein Q4B22_07790 [Eubacteriales bacterium]|nr:hypothetical protein [Eubacteriales bacterium]
MKRRVSAVLLILVLMFGFSACGNKNDARLGRYTASEINMLGWKPITEVYSEGSNYLELKAGGKGAFCLNGSQMSLRWEEAESVVGSEVSGTSEAPAMPVLSDSSTGTALKITIDGEEMYAVLEDTNLTLNFLGFDMKFIRTGE